MTLKEALKGAYLLLQSPRGKKISRNIFGAVAALTLVALSLPYLYSADYLKKQLQTAFKEATGMYITDVSGINLKILPWPVLEARELRVENPNFSSATTPFMTSKAVRIELPLSALFGLSSEVQNVVLDTPEINLMVNREGRPNWYPNSDVLLNSSTNTFVGSAIDMAKLFPLYLVTPKLQLKNATVHYINTATQKRVEVTTLKSQITYRPNDKYLIMQGSAVIDSEPSDWVIEIFNTQAFYSAERSKIRVSFANKSNSLNLYGFYERNGYSGDVNISLASLKEIAPSLLEYETVRTLKTPMELGFEGHNVSCTRATCNIGDGRFRLDRINGKFSGNIAFDKAIPSISIKLDIGRANLRPMLGDTQITLTEMLQRVKKQNGEQQKNKKEPEPEEPKNVWSNTPFDLHLPKAKLDIAFNFGLIETNLFRVNDGSGKLRLENNLLNLDIKKLTAYDGIINSSLFIDNSGSEPEGHIVINASDVEVGNVLDALRIKRVLDGRSNITLNMTGGGKSPAQLVRSLSGGGMIFSRDTMVKGVDLSALFYNLPRPSPKVTMHQNTQLDALYGSIDIKNGVVSSEDLYARSRTLKMKVQGNLNLANNNHIRMQFTPIMVLSLERLSADKMMSYPLTMAGSLDDVEITADLKKPIKRDDAKIRNEDEKRKSQEANILSKTGAPKFRDNDNEE